jgi:fumarate reductase subunit C
MEHQPYVRPKDRLWFLRNPAYKKYMLRESTSILMGLWVLNICFGVLRLSQGEHAWDQWLAWQGSGFMVGFSALTFLMAMFHTATWFAVAPKAMPKMIAGKKIEEQPVVIGHWAVFVLISIGLILFAVYGG